MQDNNQNQTKGPWWKAGVQVFSEVSTWIVVPIVLALIFGKMLDERYGTTPVIFLCFVAVGFLFTIYGIFKITKNYMKKVKDGEIK